MNEPKGERIHESKNANCRSRRWVINRAPVRHPHTGCFEFATAGPDLAGWAGSCLRTNYGSSTPTCRRPQGDGDHPASGRRVRNLPCCADSSGRIYQKPGKRRAGNPGTSPIARQARTTSGPAAKWSGSAPGDGRGSNPSDTPTSSTTSREVIGTLSVTCSMALVP